MKEKQKVEAKKSVCVCMSVEKEEKNESKAGLSGRVSAMLAVVHSVRQSERAPMVE